MVNISSETPLQTELRLRKVIRTSTLKIYDGPYSFHEVYSSEETGQWSAASLAVVKDDHVTSLLTQARPEDEAFIIWRFHFEHGVDNSGFVGWLASLFKDELGTGVFVTCGQNSQAGGIYDYWGAPFQLKEDVTHILERLTKPAAAQATTDKIDLNRVMMRVTDTSPNSEISTDTVFLFRQAQNIVTADYEGGAVLHGHLIGDIIDRQLHFQFVQVNRSGKISSGQSVCDIAQNNGRYEITEHFTWQDDSAGTGKNVFTEFLD